MFFKRSSAGKTHKSADEKAPKISVEAAAAPEAAHREPLPISQLRRTVDPKSLGFKTTAELEPIVGLIGQDRALRAIQFGADMKARDFNMFVLGPPASGKSTAVKQHLASRVDKSVTPPDWVYVNNFEQPNKPKALRLPAGRATMLAKAMVAAIDELRATIPAGFESEDYQARRRAIEEEFRAGQEQALESLNRKAQAQNIAVLRTPMGFAMAPTHEGKVVKPEVFSQLPEPMRKDVEARIEALQKELELVLAQSPRSEKTRRARIEELNASFAKSAAVAALDDVKIAFADQPHVVAYLDDAEEDLIRNAALFLTPAGEESEIIKEPADTSRDPRFRRYMVNVMVGNGAAGAGAPIYEELNPTFGNVIGRIEHIAHMGTLVTDFLLLKPGALHRANGGYLLIDARKLLMSPFSWDALKRALKTGEIKIELPGEAMGLMSTQTLEPEPIPLEIKVVLFGERQLYYLLAEHEPDFQRLFKVQADFDDSIERSADNDRAYARLIAAIVRDHALKPFEAGAVAAVIEQGARLAADSEKVSVEIGRIADLVREADYWAGEAGRASVADKDVDRAIREHIKRADRMRERAQETIGRGVVLVDTDGDKVGQINGLAVLQLGDFAFGRPNRITARVRMGAGRVTDIEREAKLGGALHSKGVMILWGFLAGRYAQDVPLALAATLVFEQSYGGVDGDSASSTELYALLSALAEVPIRQGFAVTGSVNQWGEVQAIGGVNEKVEGFFDVCRARGLTGRQGVLIPQANVQHLMLREDVVKAIEDGQFAVHAVSTVDEGIELLTGLQAGERGADGAFPAGTINRLVEDKLRTFAERARAFGGTLPGGAASRGNGSAAS